MIEKLKCADGKVRIWGITISGMGRTTEQYTDPFYLEIWDAGNNWVVLFADADRAHVSYNDERFRDAWNRDFYSTAYWDVGERNWLYEVTV